MPQRVIQFAFRSVRSRLVLLVGTITCGALVLGLLLVRQAEKNEREAVAQQLSVTARALASAVDLQLGQSEMLLRALAASPHLHSQDFEAFDATARTLAQSDKVWIALADPTGRQLVNTRVARGVFLPPYIVEDNLKLAMQRGEIYVSDFTVGALTRQSILYMAVPVLNGRFYLSMAMEPSVFAEALAVRQLAPNGTVAIIDRKGVIAARNRSPEKFVGTKASPDIVRITAAQPHGVVESITLDQIPVLTAFQRAQSGWTVIVAMPRAEIYASVGKLSRMALGFSGLLLGLAVFVAVWIGHGVVQGVRTLVADAETIAEGGTPPYSETGLAETDLVANAMRRTSEQLKLREEELRLANDKLEQKVLDRTASLQETTQQLETFCYSVAHDLRSPLRAQQGFAEALLQEYHNVLDENGRNYLVRISRSAKRLDTLVNDLLTYTRVTRSELRFDAVDLNHTLTEVRIHLAEQLAMQHARLTVEPLPSVSAHEPTLGLVLTNLVSNAIKFVPPGVEPEVRIRAEEKGAMVRIWVEDNGIGINSEYRDKIFGVFERLHSPKAYPGTGIGLAIVKKAVERMGGTVGVVSEPGKGSRFWLELPRP